MKGPLLSLWLVGAAFYTGDTLMMLQQITAPARLPFEARATLPYQRARMANTDSEHISLPKPQNPEGGSMAVRVAAVAPDDAQSIRPSSETSQIAKIPTPLLGTEESSAPPISESGNEEAIWVVVSRAASVHSGPSVSAPIVYRHPLGTELRLIDYQQGWFQVLDPATAQQGWIYEKYLEAIRAPNQRQAASQPIQIATREEFQKPPSPQPSARAKKQQPNRANKQQRNNVERAQSRNRGETFASLLEKAFRGY
jgi:Bacterial SH3 domain